MIPKIFGSLDFQLEIRTDGYFYCTRFKTKIRSTMLCLSGFELYSRWVPLIVAKFLYNLVTFHSIM